MIRFLIIQGGNPRREIGKMLSPKQTSECDDDGLCIGIFA